MVMTRSQWGLIGLSLVVVLLLYVGFDIAPPASLDLEKSRSVQIESTGIENLEKQALGSMPAEQKSLIEAVMSSVEKSADTIQKISALQNLSGTWYDLGFPGISGYYAEEVANFSKTAESWSIAGTTFAICYKQTTDEKTKNFCWKRAVHAFESALSIEPDKIETRINLAICYVDVPPTENPMQGILMLRTLNNQYPGKPAILNQLAKLALQTGQIDKAVERLMESWKVDSINQETACLLADAFAQKGDEKQALKFKSKCNH